MRLSPHISPCASSVLAARWVDQERLTALFVEEQEGDDSDHDEPAGEDDAPNDGHVDNPMNE